MATYDVGGINLARPFKAQRFGHLAFLTDDQESLLKFYSDLLGMQVQDTADFSEMLGRSTPGRDGNVYFMRIASDHHATVIFPKWAMPGRPGGFAKGVEHLAHMAWQVGTMSEVLDGGQWLRDQGWVQARPGSRDPAGSNYNSTVIDPHGLPVEIYYGMDQIGWDGLSKPVALRPEDDQPLPPPGGSVPADFPGMKAAIQSGADLRSGHMQRPSAPPQYQVDGVMLPRPFRIIRNSPVGLFVPNMEAALHFYESSLGLTLTESAHYRGHRCCFLRANSEHHSVALYPVELRDLLGMWPDTICAYYGLQVQNYRQLRDALTFLRQNGVEIRAIPPELTPGIEYAALVMAPDGHAVLLYHAIEQIGWDGKTRPASDRTRFGHPDSWPQSLPGRPDSYTGCVLQGPLG